MTLISAAPVAWCMRGPPRVDRPWRVDNVYTHREHFVLSSSSTVTQQTRLTETTPTLDGQ